mmetsp:Transcript_30951/g.62828  ORF Transcript_30951/g.62828 Transcript_30951/m.62828 type:complete len:194 (+) Transcript_30951:25-606(+)
MMTLKCFLLTVLIVLGTAFSSRSNKVGWARQMVETYDWGILSTISTLPGLEGTPFGNPISIAQVEGTPYFYVSALDQSLKDIASNSHVSLTLSDAEALKSPACGTVPKAGDPESPLCSRLTISGTFLNISGTDEAPVAWEALVAAHPAMAAWPADHSWFIGKLEISNLWLINIFGGASIITPDQYYQNNTVAA